VKDGSKRCPNNPINGGRVCSTHGGLAPAAQVAAKQRMLAMVEPALTEIAEARRTLDRIRKHPEATFGEQVQAAVHLARIGFELLDRNGYGARHHIEPEPIRDIPLETRTREDLEAELKARMLTIWTIIEQYKKDRRRLPAQPVGATDPQADVSS